MKTTLAIFNHRTDVEPLKKRLMDSGFPVWIATCQPPHCVRLEVPADQFGRAYQLLVDWDAKDQVLADAIRCPECRSMRVEYPQYSRKCILPNILVGFMNLIGATDKEFYCQDCHFTWPREGTKPSRLRPHSAPYYFIEGVEQAQLPPNPEQRAV